MNGRVEERREETTCVGLYESKDGEVTFLRTISTITEDMIM